MESSPESFRLINYDVDRSHRKISRSLTKPFTNRIVKGTAAMVFIIFQASSVFRRAFYETFLHIHIALVILAIAGIWLHLEGTAQLFYIQIVVGAWAVEVS